MNRITVLSILAMTACESTPPAGTRNLSSPVKPVFLANGDQELLAFIDQGHDAIRVLDLSAGTYQWGSNPYFPREVALDDSPIDLAYDGEALVALSLSGQVFTIPTDLSPVVSIGLATSDSPPIALIPSDTGLWRLDADCSLTPTGAGEVIETAVLGCHALGHGFIQSSDLGLSRIVGGAHEAFAQVERPARAMRPAADGGWWLLSRDLRILFRLDADGAELRRMALPFDVIDVVETADDEGPILSMVGLDSGVVYMREDGIPLPPHGSRSIARLTTLVGENNGLSVARDLETALSGEDLLAVSALPLGEATVTVAAVEGALTIDGLPETESRPYIELSLDDQRCAGRIDAEGTLPGDPDCPLGEGVTATLTSAGWHLFEGASLIPDQVFDPAAAIASVDDVESVSINGQTFTATAAAPLQRAVIAGRGQNGAGSSVLTDGWFSDIIAAEAKTNYADAPQTWLWMTSPSENAIIQMPVLASETYSVLMFR